MTRPIKFRQRIVKADGSFSKFAYWGFIDDEFRGPAHQFGHPSTAKESDEFTGLKDKNGKEVYEGDIRREEIETDEGDEREYYACVWINEWSMFAWLHLPGEYYNYLDNGAENLDTTMYWTYPASKDEESKIIVCGNIHKNPELLK